MTHQYSQELYVSSFAGLAPIDAPRVAVVVIIDEPHGEHYYGARVAGPAFVRVVDETLRYLGVPPQSTASPSAARPAGPGHIDEPIVEPPAIADAPAGAPAAPAAEPAVSTDPEAPLDRDAVHVLDFRGMGMGRVLELARAAGIAVEIEGSGRAVEQDPPPGLVPRPATCRVLFSSAQAAAPVAAPQ